MRVLVLLVLLVLMSITPPTLAVTTATAAATTTLPVEPDGGSDGQPGEPRGRPTTTVVSSSSSSPSSGSECDPSYPTVCLPTPPPDLNCTDISERRFEVVGSDPHALDGDNNGIACEGPPPIPLQEPQRQQEAQEQNQTETQNLTTSTTPFITNATTKTDGLLTASINGTSFTTNQTILVNGTMEGQEAGPSGTLYISLRDPHNEAVLYDSANMTTGSFDTLFSYKLVAGDVEKNNTTSDSRTVYKPMNESGQNYTMTVGYTLPQVTPSEVQFVFAYDHLLDAGEAAEEPTTPPASEGEPLADVTPPRQPPRVSPPAEEEPEEEQREEDDDEDDDNGDDEDDDDDNGDDEDDDNGDSGDDGDDDDNGDDDESDEGEDGDDGEEDGDNGDGDNGDEEDDQEDEEAGLGLDGLLRELDERRGGGLVIDEEILNRRPPLDIDEEE